MLKSTANSIITITDGALSHVKELLEKRGHPSYGLRIGVKSGGCSGLTYEVSYADERGKYDEELKIDDINIIIDPKAIMYLLGTEMDYMETDFKSGFVFNNPNEKGKCGCGKSFNI
jgi:iron-sulfur cluster assembly protein